MAEDNRRTSAPPDAAVNDRVAEVASRMPFGKTFIEDYAEGVLQIDLGATGEDEGHDRAGIDGTGPEYRWWVETPYGDRQEWSDLGFDADPTEVATWVTRQALTLNSPAATFRREITPVQLDEQQIDTLRHELLDYAEWINTAEFTDAEVRDAAARGHRLDVPMDMYTGIARNLPAAGEVLYVNTVDERLSEVFHRAGWSTAPDSATPPHMRSLVETVESQMLRVRVLDAANAAPGLSRTAATTEQLAGRISALETHNSSLEVRLSAAEQDLAHTRSALISVARKLDPGTAQRERQQDPAATGPVTEAPGTPRAAPSVGPA